ncbi:hypothetical protein TTHERM_00444760 (macronuclear) [Tetrahymena thermophila SB210]|uniref:Uncharacterized protein n=1 Tax=Tetrahymena thermophila (strain SB210) TaxID=312017 RepID=I7M9Z3_TETTS|nr:hypothetical protein TTHERM_00444760 [Tetrahymena thermophila SB210]EAS03094.1 hypothetical protein TTHERM_00444760 [Tetrahymena thermophila SB210]|eukprot:XP_001023339.1 hypothetical protein TTHERM_00444760 [Tetrahymena thermophila SB210]
MIEEENQEGLDFFKNFKYSEYFSNLNNKLFIMQVPQQILDELKQKEEISIISKDKNDIAKLVSNTETYKIKRFDYPNSYFLNEKIDDNFYVQASTKSVFQLEKQANQKDNLYKFLKNNELKESDFDGDLRGQNMQQKGFEINDLINDYFISRNNLLEFCKEIYAIKLEEKIFFLETEIFLKIFREILNILSNNQENAEFSYKCITLESLKEIFPSINEEILLTVMNQFSKQFNTNEENKDSVQFSLTYESLIKFIMTELYLAKKEYYMDDFIEFTEKMIAVYIPEQIQNEIAEQEKLVTIQKMRNKFFIAYDTNNYQFAQGIDMKKITLVGYNHYFYTFDAKERVAFLFEKKKNFFPNEFREYLEVLNLQKKELDDLVLNSCRSISISIHKKNQEIFSRIYPNEPLNKDKLNPENFSCKVYNYKKK